MSRSKLILLAGSALQFAFAGAALAQSAPAEPRTTSYVDDIVVTATRVETNLQNTPVAITALSADSLEQRGVQSLLEVGNYVPSLVIGGRGGSGTNQGSVAIRGIGADAPDSAPSVGIYIDEVYYPSGTGNLLGLFDVARIEVLRGPQGTLFGRNTIAGAVQYVSTKPDPDGFASYLQASVGSNSSSEASGAVNIPLSETLAARLSAQRTQRGGYIRDLLNGIDRGEETTEQARIQLRWTPSSRLVLDFKAETLRSESNGRPLTIGGFNPARAGAYLSATGVIPVLPPFLRETRPFLPEYVSGPNSYSNAGYNQPDFLNVSYDAANVVVAYDLTDSIRLKSISAFSNTETHIVTDFDATPLFILSSDRGVVTTDLFTQELQLTGDSFGDRLHWTTGVFYYDSSEETKGQIAGIGLAVPPPNPTTHIDTESFAVYGQATYDLTSTLGVTAGLRYSKEKVDAVYDNGAFATNSEEFTDTSPYFGVNWQLADTALLYAKASKGFRAGGFHLDAGLPNGSLYFAPETAWTYEAGARLTLLDRRLRLNPTVYWTDWENIQFVYITLPQGTPIAATQNAGDARQKGFELEGQYALTDDFQLTGSFSYLDAKYTRLAPPTPGSIPIVLTLNDDMARAPEFKYAVGARYRRDLAGGEMVSSIDYAWTDTQRSSVDGDQAISLPSYGLLNARLQFTPAGGTFTFAVYGTNLTDEYYLLDGINFQSSAGVQTQTVGRPREFGFSVKAAF